MLSLVLLLGVLASFAESSGSCTFSNAGSSAAAATAAHQVADKMAARYSADPSILSKELLTQADLLATEALQAHRDTQNREADCAGQHSARELGEAMEASKAFNSARDSGAGLAALKLTVETLEKETSEALRAKTMQNTEAREAAEAATWTPEQTEDTELTWKSMRFGLLNIPDQIYAHPQYSRIGFLVGIFIVIFAYLAIK